MTRPPDTGVSRQLDCTRGDLMALKTVKCSVLGARVDCLTGLDGEVSTVICPERAKATGVCRLKAGPSRGGPLSLLLERPNGAGRATSHLCHVRTPVANR